MHAMHAWADVAFSVALVIAVIRAASSLAFDSCVAST
jgi:hypothetical protein